MHLSQSTNTNSSYGWDDANLYGRLEGVGLIRKDIHPDYLFHIPHDNFIRTQYQNVDDVYKRRLHDLIVFNEDASTDRGVWGTEIDHKFGEFDIFQMILELS